VRGHPTRRVRPARRSGIRRGWPIRLAGVLLGIIGLVPTLAPTAGAARLCFDPVRLPFEADERADRLERRVADVFRAAGFEVVASEQVKSAIERVDETWGEVFDPLTGRRDVERFDRFLAELRLALGERGLGCDHRLFVSVVQVRSPFSGGGARWDGRVVSITSTGRQLLNVLGGVAESGWVAALSLWVAIGDLDGEPLGFRSAGIEPLIRLSVTRGTDQLPEDNWLTDEVALDEAIRAALGPEASALRDQGTPMGAIPGDRLVWPLR